MWCRTDVLVDAFDRVGRLLSSDHLVVNLHRPSTAYVSIADAYLPIVLMLTHYGHPLLREVAPLELPARLLVLILPLAARLAEVHTRISSERGSHRVGRSRRGRSGCFR